MNLTNISGRSQYVVHGMDLVLSQRYAVPLDLPHFSSRYFIVSFRIIQTTKSYQLKFIIDSKPKVGILFTALVTVGSIAATFAISMVNNFPVLTDSNNLNHLNDPARYHL